MGRRVARLTRDSRRRRHSRFGATEWRVLSQLTRFRGLVHSSSERERRLVGVAAMCRATRDAEHRRLSAEAEQLLREQAALVADPDPDAFEAYVQRLRTHIVKLAAHVAALPQVH